MEKILALIVVILTVSCQGKKKEEASVEKTKMASKTAHHSPILTHILEAHGGFDTWDKMQQLSYDMSNGEHHLIDLKSRRVRIDAEAHAIGFDGNEVWLSPADAKVSSPRFYHNLYFYFFAMPFVVGDPGVFYAEVEEKELLGKAYKGLKISYDEGIGNSPKDNYIIYYDAETKQMEWLMYTVTYRSQQPSSKFNLIKYDGWQQFNGLKLPIRLKWYHYKDGEVGEERSEVNFMNIVINHHPSGVSLFAKPTGARVD